jgi:hypothetical protein
MLMYYTVSMGWADLLCAGFAGRCATRVAAPPAQPTKFVRLPVAALPLLPLGLVFLAWFIVAVIDQVALRGLQAISVRDVRAFSERPTINSADRMKIVALASVLSIVQKVAAEVLATEKDGAIPPDAVARERDFMTLKLAGLFSLSSEIAEDLEVQEDGTRARAQELRQTAEANLG